MVTEALLARITDLETKVSTLIQYQDFITKHIDNKLDRLAPIGSIQLYAGTDAVPEGFKECNGDAFTSSEYPKLFHKINFAFNPRSYTYKGDDFTKYDPPVTDAFEANLPNVANKIPVGAGICEVLPGGQKVRLVGEVFGRDTGADPFSYPSNPPIGFKYPPLEHPERISDIRQRPSVIFRFIIRVE
jgi:hypothetical protein